MTLRKEPSLAFKRSFPGAMAIKAVCAGTADTDQQQRAMKYIVTALCERNKGTFVPGHADIGAYLQGRLSVGLEIELCAALPSEELKTLIEGRRRAEG